MKNDDITYGEASLFLGLFGFLLLLAGSFWGIAGVFLLMCFLVTGLAIWRIKEVFFPKKKK